MSMNLPNARETSTNRDNDLKEISVLIHQKLRGLAHIPSLGGKGLALIAALAAVAWIISGIYKVQPDEQGVVLHFGKWIETTEPGLHYHLPYPIETVLLPKVTQINQLQLGGGGVRRQATHQEPDAHRRREHRGGGLRGVLADQGFRQIPVQGLRSGKYAQSGRPRVRCER